MIRADDVLYEFLVEDSNMSVKEYNLLTEEDKTNLLTSIGYEVIQNISKKVNNDVLFIDKTRGDIKNLAELQTIQDAITKIVNLSNVDRSVITYTDEIKMAIYNLNKYSAMFKDAYRNKKTFLILYYEGVIISVISTLSYLVSAVVDFKNPQQLQFKQNIQLDPENLMFKFISDFNKKAKDGTADMLIKSVSTLREFYNEYSVDDMKAILEAVEIAPLLNKGLTVFSDFFKNTNRNGIILKAIGVILLILSLRDVFYTLSNSRIKIMEKLSGLKTFLSINNLPSVSTLTKFTTFNNKNVAETEYATKAAEHEIAVENKEIIQNVKNAPTSFEAETKNDFIPAEIGSEVAATPADTSSVFASFNF